MAGSFKHCDDDGKFTFEHIENMGDAIEACFMMWWMLHHSLNEEQLREAEEAYFRDAEEPW